MLFKKEVLSLTDIGTISSFGIYSSEIQTTEIIHDSRENWGGDVLKVQV